MEQSSPPSCTARLATMEDRKEIWEWWNDPTTRKMMKDNATVPWETHCRWFDELLSDKHRVLCIGETPSGKVGVVRFDFRAPGIFEVSINFNPMFRGKGLAAALINSSIPLLQQRHPVSKLVAAMKKWNDPSRKTFARAGFSFGPLPTAHPSIRAFDAVNEFYCERVLAP